MSTAPQNIYDDPDFFAGYARLRENPLSANAVIVDPCRDALLPSLIGQRVIDLGCGAGDFCRLAVARGAYNVFGVDISERMLGAAQSHAVSPDTEPRLRYARASLDKWTPESPESADVIVSVLALHYLEDVAPVWTNVAATLTPGGVFLFCVEHPVVTARRTENAWVRDSETGAKRFWSVDDYADESERTASWMVPGVRIYHRTLATYINGVLNAGLRITAIAEPLPNEHAVAARPAFADERRRPTFLFLRAEKG